MSQIAVLEPEPVREENYSTDFLLSRFRSKTNWSMYHRHKHNVHEMYFLLAGDVRYDIDGRMYNVAPGNIVIIPKDTPHRTLHLSEKSYERLLIYFSDIFLQSLSKYAAPDILDQLLGPLCIQFEPEYTARIHRIFAALQKEQSQPDAYSALENHRLFQELIVIILRHGNHTERSFPNSTDSKIYSAVRYTNDNIDREITLKDAAEIASMAPTYFSRAFKKTMGQNFQDYLACNRLQQARYLLSDSPLSIAQIAENCGFLNANYFGDFFKKQTGLSPSEYRKTRYQP